MKSTTKITWLTIYLWCYVNDTIFVAKTFDTAVLIKTPGFTTHTWKFGTACFDLTNHHGTSSIFVMTFSEECTYYNWEISSRLLKWYCSFIMKLHLKLMNLKYFIQTWTSSPIVHSLPDASTSCSPSTNH